MDAAQHPLNDLTPAPAPTRRGGSGSDVHPPVDLNVPEQVPSVITPLTSSTQAVPLLPPGVNVPLHVPTVSAPLTTSAQGALGTGVGVGVGGVGVGVGGVGVGVGGAEPNAVTCTLSSSEVADVLKAMLPLEKVESVVIATVVPLIDALMVVP